LDEVISHEEDHAVHHYTVLGAKKGEVTLELKQE
jgi:hypothetical protein